MNVYVTEFWSNTCDAECGERPTSTQVFRSPAGAAESLLASAATCDIGYLRGCGSSDERTDREFVVNAFKRALGRWLETDGVDTVAVESVGPMALVTVRELRD